MFNNVNSHCELLIVFGSLLFMSYDDLNNSAALFLYSKCVGTQNVVSIGLYHGTSFSISDCSCLCFAYSYGYRVLLCKCTSIPLLEHLLHNPREYEFARSCVAQSCDILHFMV